jgi:hypothetical protein
MPGHYKLDKRIQRRGILRRGILRWGILRRGDPAAGGAPVAARCRRPAGTMPAAGAAALKRVVFEDAHGPACVEPAQVLGVPPHTTLNGMRHAGQRDTGGVHAGLTPRSGQAGAARCAANSVRPLSHIVVVCCDDTRREPWGARLQVGLIGQGAASAPRMPRDNTACSGIGNLRPASSRSIHPSNGDASGA